MALRSGDAIQISRLINSHVCWNITPQLPCTKFLTKSQQGNYVKGEKQRMSNNLEFQFEK